MTRGAQLALRAGSRDLQGVPTLDRVRLVEGRRHGAGDLGQRVQAQLSGSIGEVDQNPHGGVLPGPSRLDALEKGPGALDDGGEQLGESACNRVGHGRILPVVLPPAGRSGPLREPR